MSEERVKFVLDEPEIPTHWINLMADLPGDARPRRFTRVPSSRLGRTT